MATGVKLIVYPAKDVEAAKIFFSTFLGVGPYVESPYYVGFRVGDQEVGLDPNSTVGPIAYTDVEDRRRKGLAGSASKRRERQYRWVQTATVTERGWQRA
jgi:hypothetical protein